jgi:hypothetical protein
MARRRADDAPSGPERRRLASCLGNCVMQMDSVIQLAWLPHWQAYAVRLNDRMIGMIRCKPPYPFNLPVRFR